MGRRIGAVLAVAFIIGAAGIVVGNPEDGSAGKDAVAREEARELFKAEVCDCNAGVIQGNDMALFWSEDGTLTFKKKKDSWIDVFDLAGGRAQAASSLAVGVRPFDPESDVNVPVIYEHRCPVSSESFYSLYTIYIEDEGEARPAGVMSLPGLGDYTVQTVGSERPSSWAFTLTGAAGVGFAFVFDCESEKLSVLSDDRIYSWHESDSCLVGIGWSYAARESTPVRVCDWDGSVLYEREDAASAVFDRSESAVYFVTYADDGKTALVWAHSPGSGKSDELLSSIRLPEEGPHDAWVSLGAKGLEIYVGCSG